MAARWCLFTAHDATYGDIAAVTVPAMRRYAARHGMECRVFVDRDCGRPASWLKIPLARELFAEGFDAVFWVDADALIVRFDVDIRAALAPDRDFHFVVEPHALAKSHRRINAGVFVWLATPATRAFLDAVWARTEYRDHPWWDQAAIIATLGLYSMFEGEDHGPDRPSEHAARLGALPVEWNVGIGFYTAPRPVIVHAMALSPGGKRLALRAADALAAMPRIADGGALGAAMHALGRDFRTEFPAGPPLDLSRSAVLRREAVHQLLLRQMRSPRWLAAQLWRRLTGR